MSVSRRWFRWRPPDETPYAPQRTFPDLVPFVFVADGDHEDGHSMQVCDGVQYHPPVVMMIILPLFFIWILVFMIRKKKTYFTLLSSPPLFFFHLFRIFVIGVI